MDGHHIRHWVQGGETSLANLVSLCRRHHRLVHEGGYGVVRLDDGAFAFTQPEGAIPAWERLPAIDPATTIESLNERQGLEIDARTCIPGWYGEKMCLDDAIFALYQCRRHAGEPRADVTVARELNERAAVL